MLHSFHYYACYYALICLLHQQQQAASITIIIEGVKTNEWNTQDDYQRLIDQKADFNQPLSQLESSKAKIHTRESAPTKVCGRDFIDLIDVLCEGRYYQPKVVEPTIKYRRNVNALAGPGGPAESRVDIDSYEAGGGGEAGGDGEAFANPMPLQYRSRSRNRNRNFGRALTRLARQSQDIELYQSECCKRACTYDEMKSIYCEKSNG